jgi:uncharacterized protein YoxC
MTTQLHQAAKNSTPQDVNVPNTYTGLIVWAVGKWGIGVVFAAFLIPVYQDLKASNQRLADISQANVQVLTALAGEIKSMHTSVSHLEDRVERLADDVKP